MILASGSPRRRELLALAGFDFTVEVSNETEEVCPGLTPSQTVERLSEQKALSVAKKHVGETVVGADTVVALGSEILGKPKDESDAVRMLTLLSGREHEVFTGVCIANGNEKKTFHVCTKVRFFELTAEEIAAYAATGEPLDKAGAYGIQGRGCVLVEGITGDYFNVVGFPVSRFCREIERIEAR